MAQPHNFITTGAFVVVTIYCQYCGLIVSGERNQRSRRVNRDRREPCPAMTEPLQVTGSSTLPADKRQRANVKVAGKLPNETRP